MIQNAFEKLEKCKNKNELIEILLDEFYDARHELVMECEAYKCSIGEELNNMDDFIKTVEETLKWLW